MLKNVAPLVIVAAVSACSSPIDRRQANNGDEYLQAGTVPRLIIPAELNAPLYSKEYEIPPLGPQANPEIVGLKLDIRPPLQVVPMAEGTHVEESSEHIKIVIESIDNSVDLREEIYSALQGFLAKQQVAVRTENQQEGYLETEWIETEEVIDSSFWSADQIYQLRQRYRFDVEIRPHGRTGNVVIQLVEHEEKYNGKDQEIVLSGADKRRYTIDMLNSAIAYMSVKREKAMKAKRLAQSKGIEVGIAASDSGARYWLADAQYKLVWDRLRIVLPEMGLEITDMDNSKGLLFLNFVDDSGFWSSLWGDTRLPLKEGAYRLLLQDGESADQTKIMLRDKEDKPLDNELISEIYTSFADLMKEDRKVR
jgi:outer membrane protein assembly factor BamC